MSKPFDAQIDALYAVPLSQFVAARAALAKSATGEDAKRIKALGKPTTLPWVVNQLRWHERAAYERVMKAGATLRTAQVAALEGRGGAVGEAAGRHRQALADAVGAAMRLAREGGVNVDSEALQRMLETVSLADSLKEPHGRFTDVVRPAGFEALLGVAVKAPPLGQRASGAAPKAAARAAGPEVGDRATQAARHAAEMREREETAAAARHAAAVKKAERVLADARDKETTAREAWREARDRADEAERQLETLKKARR